MVVPFIASRDQKKYHLRGDFFAQAGESVTQ
jgi:hypothetical protein